MPNKNLQPQKSRGLLQNFDRFFDEDLFPANWPSLSRSSMADIRESENGYVVSADIPGIPKDQVHVSVNGNRLTIRAEHRQESGSEESEEGYKRQYRSYHQSFVLPSDADGEQVEAHCENGHLDIWVPKTDQPEGRKIEVQSGKKGFLDRFFKSSAEKH